MTANFDANSFIQRYPKGALQSNGYELFFESEDSTYHVHIPEKKGGRSKLEHMAGGGLRIELYQEHHRGTGHDDKTVSTLVFDGAGKLTSSLADLQIQIDEGEKYHINTKASDALVKEIEALGAILAVETEGISVAIAEEIAEDIKLFVKAFNGFFAVADFFAEDGGKLNFPAVVCHNMNKLCASIQAKG